MNFFLDLAPQFGGTRFGPFSQGATLGSNPERCHITLPAEMGILPVHAWIAPAGAGLTLQVSEVGAAVYLMDAGQPSLVQGSRMVGPGDVLILGHPSGVRFTLYTSEQASGQPRPPAQAALAGRRGPPTAAALAAEAKRQAGVAMMTTKTGAQAGHFLHRLQSGAFTNPRVIITGILSIGGMLIMGCSGLLAILRSLL